MYFVTTYSRFSQTVINIVKYYWDFLITLKDVNNWLPDRFKISYKVGRNINNFLVKGKFVIPPTNLNSTFHKYGTDVCGKCKACKFIVFSLDRINGVRFNTKGNCKCNTEGIIYVLKCPCNKF